MAKVISYVLPVYNEGEGIEQFYAELSMQLRRLGKQRYELELIFINDGSRDDSLEKLLSFQKQNPQVKVINFSRNFGHQMAITAGLDLARGDAVIIMDTDLQDPPSVSLELIKEWENGYEVVYAKRKTRQDSFMKKFTAKMFYVLLEKLADIKIPRDTGDFRLMDRKVVDQLIRFREKNRYMRGLVSFIGFKQTAVLFDRHERFAGKSGYPFSKMLKLAFDGITSFSTKPLQFIMQFGFVVSFLSFIGIVYALILRLFFPQITVSGWTMLIISVLFIGGVQMIMLGILGVYVGRIYSEVQLRPLYIISEIYGDTSANKHDPEQI